MKPAEEFVMTEPSLPPPPFRLQRDDHGRLEMIHDDGTRHEGVTVVRAFPISAPAEGWSIVSIDGRELAWIEHPQQWPQALRALMEEELASREFMPEIRRIHEVSGFVTPSTWLVATDRGDARFVLPGEEAIRRLARGMLLISDSQGIHYLIRDLPSLDKQSRKLLDRFL